MNRKVRHSLAVLLSLAVGFGAAMPGCGGGGSEASGPTAAQEIKLGQWWVTLFAGGVGDNLTVTGGGVQLSGSDTINFGYGSLGQVGALHSTGSFRPLKSGWAHNIYSTGFGGTQFSGATVSLDGENLVIATDVGTTYRVPPSLGGVVTVSGAKVCLVTSGSAALARGALVDDVRVSIPVGTVYQGIGTASGSFGVEGQDGVDSLVVFASGAVEAHNDNLGDPDADDVYVRIAAPPASYSFQMR